MKTEMVQELIKADPYLEGFKTHLQNRLDNFNATLVKIGDVDTFSKGHLYYGFNREKNMIVYREWAPAAKNAYLTGDFNNWGKLEMKVDQFGVWSCKVADIPNNSKVKIMLELQDHSIVYRIPAYIKRAIQDKTGGYDGVYIEDSYVFKHKRPLKPSSLKIYECHIGIASPEGMSFITFIFIYIYIIIFFYTCIQFI